MPAVGDVVQLSDGSVGVISEEMPRSFWRVQFPDGTNILTLADDIQATLSAPTYNVADDVAIMPDLGTVASVDGSDYTVTIEKSRFIEGLGVTSWTATHVVPFWRLVLDNDGRLGRIY